MAYDLKPFLEKYVPRDGWHLTSKGAIRHDDVPAEYAPSLDGPCLTNRALFVVGGVLPSELLNGTGLQLENIWAAVDNNKTGDLHPQHAEIRAEILVHCNLKETV